jgi:hypothetical protein
VANHRQIPTQLAQRREKLNRKEQFLEELCQKDPKIAQYNWWEFLVRERPKFLKKQGQAKQGLEIQYQEMQGKAESLRQISRRWTQRWGELHQRDPQMAQHLETNFREEQRQGEQSLAKIAQLMQQLVKLGQKDQRTARRPWTQFSIEMQAQYLAALNQAEQRLEKQRLWLQLAETGFQEMPTQPEQRSAALGLGAYSLEEIDQLWQFVEELAQLAQLDPETAQRIWVQLWREVRVQRRTERNIEVQFLVELVDLDPETAQHHWDHYKQVYRQRVARHWEQILGRLRQQMQDAQARLTDARHTGIIRAQQQQNLNAAQP